ncbi:hypothetical protein U1Q18_044841 [Sarracenia purpurea var. burkii]
MSKVLSAQVQSAPLAANKRVLAANMNEYIDKIICPTLVKAFSSGHRRVALVLFSDDRAHIAARDQIIQAVNDSMKAQLRMAISDLSSIHGVCLDRSHFETELSSAIEKAADATKGWQEVNSVKQSGRFAFVFILPIDGDHSRVFDPVILDERFLQSGQIVASAPTHPEKPTIFLDGTSMIVDQGTREGRRQLHECNVQTLAGFCLNVGLRIPSEAVYTLWKDSSMRSQGASTSGLEVVLLGLIAAAPFLKVCIQAWERTADVYISTSTTGELASLKGSVIKLRSGTYAALARQMRTTTNHAPQDVIRSHDLDVTTLQKNATQVQQEMALVHQETTLVSRRAQEATIGRRRAHRASELALSRDLDSSSLDPMRVYESRGRLSVRFKSISAIRTATPRTPRAAGLGTDTIWRGIEILQSGVLVGSKYDQTSVEAESRRFPQVYSGQKTSGGDGPLGFSLENVTFSPDKPLTIRWLVLNECHGSPTAVRDRLRSTARDFQLAPSVERFDPIHTKTKAASASKDRMKDPGALGRLIKFFAVNCDGPVAYNSVEIVEPSQLQDDQRIDLSATCQAMTEDSLYVVEAVAICRRT